MKALCTFVALLVVTIGLARTANGDLLAKFTGQGSRDEAKEVDYKLLNAYLVERLPDDDSVEANIEAARKLLDAKIAGERVWNSPTVDELKQFVALGDALEKSCTPSSILTLLKNDEITAGNSIEHPTKRVEIVIHRVMERHAKLCVDVYKTYHATAVERVDSVVEALEDLFLGPVITDKVNEISNIDTNAINEQEEPKIILNYSLMTEKGFLYQEFSQRLIRRLAKDDPNSRYLSPVVDQSQGVSLIKAANIRQLHDKYLIGSCKKFMDTFNFMYEFNQELIWGFIDPEDFDARFFTYYDSFILCFTLTHHESDAFFENFIEFLQAKHSTSTVVWN